MTESQHAASSDRFSLYLWHSRAGRRTVHAGSRPARLDCLHRSSWATTQRISLGVDYSAYADRGLGIIARLNHGYEPDGTLPHSSLYEAYARRVANFVATSRGCKIWVIGNEMNYAIERPGVKVDWSRHTLGA